MIKAAIPIGEVAFWVVLLGGLALRYPLARPRAGAALLVGVPLVDLVLLVVTGIDLAAGARATWSHGLAAVYLGFSVVFGPSVVRDADRRFGRRFAAGAPPPPSPRTSAERLAAHWRTWRRCVLASALACVLLGVFVLVAGDAGRSRALWAGGGWFSQLGLVCAGWLLLGPVWTAVARLVREAAARRAQAGCP